MLKYPIGVIATELLGGCSSVGGGSPPPGCPISRPAKCAADVRLPGDTVDPARRQDPISAVVFGVQEFRASANDRTTIQGRYEIGCAAIPDRDAECRSACATCTLAVIDSVFESCESPEDFTRDDDLSGSTGCVDGCCASTPDGCAGELGLVFGDGSHGDDALTGLVTRIRNQRAAGLTDDWILEQFNACCDEACRQECYLEGRRHLPIIELKRAA